MNIYRITSEKEAGEVIESLEKYGRFSNYPHSLEMYGIGYWLKKRFNIPAFIKLVNWEIQHSPPLSNKIQDEHISTKAHFFFYNEIEQGNYERKGKKGILVGSSFVHCRNLNKIKKSESAKGTIAFPVHSIQEVDLIFNWQQYAHELLNLPSQYQPVSVCLYYREIQNGAYKPFLEKNIPVFCSGHMKDYDFPLNFYNIIKNFKFSTSNAIGSYAYYSIEMGIPYFMYGKAPSIYNHGNNSGFIKGKEVPYLDESIKDFEFIRKEINLTTFDINSSVTISKDLQNYIDTKLGNNNKYNLIKIHISIWTRFIRYFLGRLLKVGQSK